MKTVRVTENVNPQFQKQQIPAITVRNNFQPQNVQLTNENQRIIKPQMTGNQPSLQLTIKPTGVFSSITLQSTEKTNEQLQKEIDNANIFKADLTSWKVGVSIENNVHLIICLTLLFLAVTFLILGIIRRNKNY